MLGLSILDKFHNRLITKDDKLYQIKIELVEFQHLDKRILKELLQEFLNDLNILHGMRLMKIPENEQIQKYGACRYGFFNDIEELDSKKNRMLCPERGTCPGEGLVCKKI